MSTIVGILNKRAAVMAADSAETVNNGFIWIKLKQWFSQQLNPQTRLLE